MLCFWTTHFTVTVLFSTMVYKRVQVNLMLGEEEGGNPEIDKHPIQRGAEILSEAGDKPGLMGHLARVQTLR